MDKVAIVTGASSGIGEATARRLARDGMCVTLAARRREELERVAAAIGDETRALVVPTDVRDRAAIQHMVQATLDRWRRVDVLVNNAGLSYPRRVIDLDPDQVCEQIDVNLIAVIDCVQAVLPAMLRQSSGHIINVASLAGLIGIPGASIYCATKSAITSFSDALRREVQDSGIRVTVLSPGFVATNFSPRLRRAAEKLANGQRVRGVMCSDVVAERVARLLRHPRRHDILPTSWRPLIAFLRAFPGLADVVLNRYYVRMRERI